ncbi:hypothetical protein F5888DRAFT_1639890 [Russula emetica]|nr:hypothetical protein F5888DRAFT_1639890 [Russula emetica]
MLSGLSGCSSDAFGLLFWRFSVLRAEAACSITLVPYFPLGTLLHPFRTVTLYIPCNYITHQKERIEFPFPPQSLVLVELSAVLPHPPDSAARVRGFSNFKGACSGPVRPYLPRYKARTSVRGTECSWYLRASVAIPDTAALVRGLISADPECIGPRWAPIPRSVFRGDLHDHSQCFTLPHP